MKRIGYLYDKIDISLCREAIINASKHKTRRKCVKEVLNNLDAYACDLLLRFQEYDFVTPYTPRIIKDGLTKKEREIMIPNFYPDQCAHHVIMLILRPIIEKTSYYWSCANIPNRGIDHASKCVERSTKRGKPSIKYCFKCDVKKFYPSIPNEMLKSLFRRKIKDERFLKVLDIVVDTCEQGLPIGNYTSPWFAEWYLQGIDNFILSQDCVKRYIRYADDMVILGTNKRKLHKLCNDLIVELAKIGLTLKGNYQVFKVQENYKGRRIDFVGKCYGIGFTTVRKRRSLVMMKQSRQIQKLEARNKPIPYKMASGFLSRSTQFNHTDSQALRVKYYDTINISKLKEVIRNHDKNKITG